MKTLVQKNDAKKVYEMVVIDDKGNKTTTELEFYKGNNPTYAGYLKLPENPANRQWIQSKVVDKNNGQIELQHKETRVINKTTHTNKKSIEDYLEGDDLTRYRELIKKAEDKMKAEAIQKAEKDVENAKAMVKKAQENLKNLTK